MDAFDLAVGRAGIDPSYFWFDLNFQELERLVPGYREGWEKTRLIVQSLTGERVKLPWDAEVEAAELAADLKRVKELQPKRIAAAASIKIK